MTCRHVLGLIDAGPFVSYPPAHLEAAWRHARRCATCGPALKAATALTSDLAALPKAALPPPDLAAVVLARISRIEEERRPVATATFDAEAQPSSARDWSTWSSGATVAGGAAAGLAFVLSTIVNSTPLDIALLSVRLTSLFAGPPTSSWSLILAAGLVVYVIGLFAPVARGKGTM
jgi:hypothetical protein